MKVCKSCNLLLPLESYYRNKSTRDGRWPECKKCNIKRSLSWISKHRDRKRRLDRESWARHRDKRLAGLKESYSKREYGGVREDIISRDGGCCVKCGVDRKSHKEKYGNDLNVDHINRDRKDNSPNNLQTLCLVCHGSKSGKDARPAPLTTISTGCTIQKPQTGRSKD